MGDAQVNEAGPERSQGYDPRASVEAAGPAGPRLVMEEVRLRVAADSREAQVTLSLGSERIHGAAAERGGGSATWQLAAAATVAAIQQCLQQCSADQPTPRVRLADLAAATTGIGREVIHAAVTVTDGSSEVHLLGSALVRNDRCSTAVAAALDATSRRVGQFLYPLAALGPPAITMEPTSPAGEVGEHELAAAVAELAAEPIEAPAPAEEEPRRSAPPALALGVEISPTSVRAAAVDAAGRILGEARRPSRASGEPEVTLGMALEAAREVVAGLDSDGHRLGGVGLAVPGRLRPEEGVCVSCGDFPGWREVQVATPFAQELGVPVSLIGTTQAAALAEVEFGVARGLANVVLVRVGADIEVAVISGGRPFAPDGCGLNQAGHMVIASDGPRCSCGESGCWQALAGREALASRVVRDIGRGVPTAIAAAVENRLGAITPALICRMAAAGDTVARAAVEETGRALAVGLGNLVTLFDPEAIIFARAPSAGGAAHRHAAEAALKASARARVFSRCVLLSPGLGDAAPVLGAAAWAPAGAG